MPFQLSRRFTHWQSDCRGITMLQVCFVLLMVTMLAALVTPAISGSLTNAMRVRAMNEARTLTVGMMRLVHDNAPDRRARPAWERYDLLVGPGETPAAGNTAAVPWVATGTGVGRLEEHLIRNDAGYPPARAASGIGVGWRGPYLETPVTADPWGRRYAVNVAALRTPDGETVVISAASDGVIESSFAGDGLMPTGDDIVVVIASSGTDR